MQKYFAIYYNYVKIIQIKSTAQFIQNRYYKLRGKAASAYSRERVAKKCHSSIQKQRKPLDLVTQKHQTGKQLA